MSGDSRSSREIDRSMFCGTPNVNPNQLTNYSEFWRYAYRSSLKANYCLKNLGFRIAY
jgi:sulfatase modifying factor 1